jgi:hypothetical protein
MKESHSPPIDWWFIEDPASKSLMKHVEYEIQPGEQFVFIVVLKSQALN